MTFRFASLILAVQISLYGVAIQIALAPVAFWSAPRDGSFQLAIFD